MRAIKEYARFRDIPQPKGGLDNITVFKREYRIINMYILVQGNNFSWLIPLPATTKR